MADVPIIRPSGRTVQDLPQITPAGGEFVRNNDRLSSAMFQLSDKLHAQVQENSFMKYQTTMSRELSRIERDNMGNPDALQKNMGAFKKSFLKEVRDPTVRKKLDYQFEVQSQPAIGRAFTKFQQNVDEDTQVTTYNAIDDIQTQMDQAAQSVFSPDQHTAQSAVVQLQDLMDRGQGLATQRKSDGSLLFTPEQVSSMMIAARDKTHTALVTSWFNNQPNKLQAAEDWLSGGVSYDLPNSDDVRGGVDNNTLFEKGLIAQESGGNQSAVSPVGAIGIAQIMPGTGPEAAKLAGVAWDEKKFKEDATYNKKLGRAYFYAQVEKYGDQTLALMAYNAGPGAVDDFMNGTNKTGKNAGMLKLGNPAAGETSVNSFVARFPFKETRDYVRGVKEKAGFTVVNVRESMPATSLKKVDAQVMSLLQDHIAIDNQKQTMQDRADKSMAQQTFTQWVQDLSKGATTSPGAGRNQDGSQAVDGQSEMGPFQPAPPITPEQALQQRQDQIAQLDSQKQIFVKGGMLSEYMTLRKSLVSGDPLVEDGASIIKMKNMMTSGQDISSMALSAMNEGRIGPSTYDDLINRQQTLRGPAGNSPQFLLGQIQSSIAGLTPSGDPNSAVLVYNAQTQFLSAVDAWKADPANQGKTPTLKDLKPLADEAIKTFNPNPDGAVLSLTAPSYIPANLYSAPSQDGVVKMQQMIKDKYSQKYNGDREKIKSDPDFIKDYTWAKQIEKNVTPSNTSVGD